MTINSEVIQNALTAWHEAGRSEFQRHYPNLIYNAYSPKRAKDGKRWIKLDSGTSGVYLVDKLSPTLDVYSIKAYGVPNRLLGTLDWMTSTWIQHKAQKPRQSRADQLAASEVIFS